MPSALDTSVLTHRHLITSEVTMLLRHFQINMHSVGYKSARFLNVSALVRITEIETDNDFDKNLFGEKRPHAYIEVTHLDNETAELFVNEMIAVGGTRGDFMSHLIGLIREIVLFGEPYPGYSIVKEQPAILSNERGSISLPLQWLLAAGLSTALYSAVSLMSCSPMIVWLVLQ